MISIKNISTIFTSQDQAMLDNLLLHLQSLIKEFNIAIWSDDAIHPGRRWEPQDESRLHDADVFLVMLSNSLLHSEFIKQDEFKMVIDRYKEGKSIIIPIVLDDCPWDIEFTSEDYNFNFGELQVFNRNEESSGDSNASNEIFKHVSYYIRGLIASSSKENVLETSISMGEKKLIPMNKEGQIAIDFFETNDVDIEEEKKRERNREARIEAEIKERVEENRKLVEEAEAKEVIRKEKRLRQKVEIQKRIKKEVEAKRVVQEQIREEEITRAQMAVAEKRRAELDKTQRETRTDERLEEMVLTQKKVRSKNGLARYNYQFDTAKLVESKKVVQKEKRSGDECKAKVPVKREKHREVTKPITAPETNRKSVEIDTAQNRVEKRNGLGRYNYQFEATKVVEAKNVAKEERWSNEKANANKVDIRKTLEDLKKSLSMHDWEKRRDAIKKSLGVAEWKIRHADMKKSLNLGELEKKRIVIAAYLREIELKKRLLKQTESSKKFLNKNRLAVKNFQLPNATGFNQIFKDAKKNLRLNRPRKIRSEFLIGGLVVFGILFFLFLENSGKQSNTISEIDEAEVEYDAVVRTDADSDTTAETNSVNQAGATLELGVGDVYKDGIIFTIDPSNETGKIASMDDEGPMAWNSAMSIHEELGEGWRLPTLDELRLMYETIGQGADNKGEFANELYWSATPFDEYQARLVRFSDGNTSYHYNSSGTFREFRVRAVRDFEK